MFGKRKPAVFSVLTRPRLYAIARWDQVWDGPDDMPLTIREITDLIVAGWLCAEALRDLVSEGQS